VMKMMKKRVRKRKKAPVMIGIKEIRKKLP
jgi:hypothetical protein